MTPLESAISQLQEELDSYQVGTKEGPREGTSGWYLTRAFSLGLSYLKRTQLLSLDSDHAAAERLYRRGNQEFKNFAVPEEEVIVRETLPNGQLPSPSV